MIGQMTLAEVQKSWYFDRKGRKETAPEWVDEERCGNCQYWQILPEYDQPPCGWGTRGLCGSHQSQNQYTTSQTSYCQEYKERSVWDG